MTGRAKDKQERREIPRKGEEPREKLLPDHTPIITVQTIHLATHVVLAHTYIHTYIHTLPLAVMATIIFLVLNWSLTRRVLSVLSRLTMFLRWRLARNSYRHTSHMIYCRVSYRGRGVPQKLIRLRD